MDLPVAFVDAQFRFTGYRVSKHGISKALTVQKPGRWVSDGRWAVTQVRINACVLRSDRNLETQRQQSLRTRAPPYFRVVAVNLLHTTFNTTHTILHAYIHAVAIRVANCPSRTNNPNAFPPPPAGRETPSAMAETSAQQQYPNLNPYANTNGNCEVRGHIGIDECDCLPGSKHGAGPAGTGRSKTGSPVTTRPCFFVSFPLPQPVTWILLLFRSFDHPVIDTD